MIRARYLILFFLLVIPGSICFAVCMYFALPEWVALQSSQANFEQIAASNGDLRTLFVAEAKQNIHRINLFAEVVWALLGALIAAIGIHGLCARE